MAVCDYGTEIELASKLYVYAWTHGMIQLHNKPPHTYVLWLYSENGGFGWGMGIVSIIHDGQDD